MSSASMAVIIIILFLFPIFMYVLYIIHVRALEQVAQGWSAAYEVSREVRHLLTTRVTTLENRLMSHSWGEFAQLQNVPTELDKEVHAEAINRDQQRLNQEFAEARMRDSGDDLEGEGHYQFEGPTVG